MREEPLPTEDVQIYGNRTRYHVVRAEQNDSRAWLRPGPVCPLLAQHHIAHAGWMDARRPFEVFRREQSGTFMLACLEGEGVVLADGRWMRIGAGQACLLPPFVANALKCLPGIRWRFAWVRYQETRESTPILSALSPVSGSFGGEPLQAAIQGLIAETSGDPQAAAIHHWVELLHHYVLRFAHPHQPDDRLWRVWQAVESDLARTWTLEELAAIGCMSREHLRRICRKQLGRSPMQQLTFLRLQKARQLLAETNDKVEVIAKAVGYESAFSFSNTFKTWIGWRPSEHRR